MNPAFERHFEEDDRNGTHAEDPMELVGAIADWIDRDKNQTSNQVGDEDRFYDFLSDPYDVKNAPFDSPREILNGLAIQNQSRRVCGVPKTRFSSRRCV